MLGNRYSGLTCEQLDKKIAELMSASEQLALGGGIAVVAGEGRRVEYTRGQSNGADKLLKEAICERDWRAGHVTGGAIGVRF
jgi:hypothetical protein